MSLPNYIKSHVVSLTKEVVKELEQYENLPLFLAALYLTADLSHELYFFDYKIKSHSDVAGWDKDQYAFLAIFDLDGKFLRSIDSLDEILNGNLSAVGGLYRSNPKFYKRLTAVYGNLAKQRLRLSYDTKFIKTPESSAKHKFIYARNKNLRNSIRKLCQSYQALSGYIPHSLVVPFLALHKNSALMESTPKGENPKIAKILKYDTQENSLKLSHIDDLKSIILYPEELATIYTGGVSYKDVEILETSYFTKFDYYSDEPVNNGAKYKVFVSDKDLDKE